MSNSGTNIDRGPQQDDSRYFNLFHSSMDAIFIIDIYGKYIDVNEAASELIGFSYDELLKMGVDDLLFPGYGMKPDERKKSWTENGTRVDTCLKHKNGNKVFVELTISPFTYNKEKFVLGIARDITEKLATEKNAYENKKRFEELFENSPVSIWEEDYTDLVMYLNQKKEEGITDINEYINNNPSVINEIIPKVKILNINNQTLKLYRADSKEDLLSNIDKTFIPESLITFKQILIAIFNGKKNFEAEAKVKSLNEDLIDVIIKCYFTEQSYGNELKYIGYISTIDISNLKMLEKSLIDSNYWLNESQKLSKIGSYVYDIKNDNWTGSDTLYEIFGIDQYYERNLRNWIDIVDEPQREEMQNYFVEHVLKSRQIFDKKYKIVTHNSKELKWVHGLGEIVLDEKGIVTRMFGTIRDITQEKKIEDEFNNQIDQLKLWNETTLDREERILELKKEVNNLLNELNMPNKYKHN